MHLLFAQCNNVHIARYDERWRVRELQRMTEQNKSMLRSMRIDRFLLLFLQNNLSKVQGPSLPLRSHVLVRLFPVLLFS